MNRIEMGGADRRPDPGILCFAGLFFTRKRIWIEARGPIASSGETKPTAYAVIYGISGMVGSAKKKGGPVVLMLHADTTSN